jgi:hypothetical protein
LIESVDWNAFREQRGFLIVLLGLVFLVSLAGLFGSLLGTNPPFQGKQIEQLQASSTFLFSFLMVIASGGGLIYLLRIWPAGQILRLLGLTFFGLLALLTPGFWLIPLHSSTMTMPTSTWCMHTQAQVQS